jgi:uncharacterized protein (TIGR00255 family)
MIKSMTGYGTASADNGKVKYSVEIKSLNSKFLELNLRLPKVVSDKELTLRTESSKLIERGKVNMNVTVEYTDQTAKASSINADLLKKYYSQLQQIAVELNDTNVNLFELALNMPEVITNNDDSVDDEESKVLMDAFYDAVKRFNTFREDEGNVLAGDLKKRAELILVYLAEVEALEVERIPLIRQRKENVDQNRFEQELVYYIDKLDVTEEKVRLRAHCNYFLKAFDSADSNGKKLGFISQEMGREINTLGSKANHAGIQQIVVRMKEELEKIKEQLLNVL